MIKNESIAMTWQRGLHFRCPRSIAFCPGDPLVEVAGADALLAYVDPDALEITDEQATTMRPFGEAFPDLFASWKRRPGRPRVEVTKVPVQLQLGPDVVEGHRASGPGWQIRMNDV